MNVLIVIISILTTFLSIKLFSKAAGSMSLLKMNTVSYVFYIQIVTSAIVASVLLVTGKIDYHLDVMAISESTKMEAWLWTMYSLLAMPFGMLLLNKVLNLDGKKLFNQYLQKEIVFEGSEKRYKLILLGTVGFSICVLAYILLNTDNIALYTLLVEGDSTQASIDRVTSRNNFGGIRHIKNLLGYIMIPVMAYFSYIMMRSKSGVYYKIIFFINFCCAVLLVAQDTQKAPVAFFILGFWILEVFISKGIDLKKLIFFVGLPVFLLLLGYSLTNDKQMLTQLLNLNSSFYGRAFVGSYLGFPLSLELFPNIISEQTYAVGVPQYLLKQIDGVNYVESARLLKIYMHPETINKGGNLYSGYYMGEAWANYGYLGLIIAPFIVGFVLHIVHLFLLLKSKKPFLIAFYVGLTVKWVVGSGFVNFLYLKLLIWPLILYFISNFVIEKILNYKK